MSGSSRKSGLDKNLGSSEAGYKASYFGHHHSNHFSHFRHHHNHNHQHHHSRGSKGLLDISPPLLGKSVSCFDPVIASLDSPPLNGIATPFNPLLPGAQQQQSSQSALNPNSKGENSHESNTSLRHIKSQLSDVTLNIKGLTMGSLLG
jgi:hypothetical protein